MRITKKIYAKATDLNGGEPVSIAFLGDSVTQGCFEVYPLSGDIMQPVFDPECAYHTYLKKMLGTVFPSVPINMINAGISGDNAVNGLQRLERDVIHFHPDLVVVCFGLNDSTQGATGIKQYTTALENIFNVLNKNDIECIFMTPNMMNTSISPHINDERIRRLAEKFMQIQNDNILDHYIEAALQVCDNLSIKVCDCYARWKKLQEAGADITALLANNLNHPSREMNYLFAASLFEILLFD